MIFDEWNERRLLSLQVCLQTLGTIDTGAPKVVKTAALMITLFPGITEHKKR